MSITKIYEGIRLVGKKNKVAYLNYIFKKSEAWKEGCIHINGKPYYRILPYQDNYISINNIKNTKIITVNKRDIYLNPELYDYSIHLKMKNYDKYNYYEDDRRNNHEISSYINTIYSKDIIIINSDSLYNKV